MENLQMKLMETSLPSQFTLNCSDRAMFDWMESRVDKVYKLLFSAAATFLAYHRSKDAGKVALTFIDDKGNFKMAAIISYHAPEEGAEDDNKGNWSIEFTLDQGDIAEIPQTYDMMDLEFTEVASRECGTIMGGRFKSAKYIQELLCIAIDTLVEFLDANAVEDTVVDIVVDDFFVASVAIEDGEKVMSIVPGAVIKRLIKDDASLV